MTNKEAIKILKVEYLGDSENMELAKYIAASALEKQIPHKIKAENIKTSDQVIRLRHCPSCNVRFVRFGMNYCSDCGQALDWSDEE